MARELTNADVTQVFNECFRETHDVVMLGGADEPLYLPPREGGPAKLFYREDFAASALHEAAHWCIAGSARRAEVDFGYTYLVPPRTPREQARFFRAEAKAQALESIFAAAAGVPFVVSVDDLDQAEFRVSSAFAEAIDCQRKRLRSELNRYPKRRASRFVTALSNYG